MKKINKVRIIERLRTRLGLTDLEKETFALPEQVLITTDVDDLLKLWRVYKSTVSRTHASGSGYVTFYTCPAGKKVKIRSINVIRISGDMTISNIYLTIVNEIQILTIAPAIAHITDILTQDVPLEEGNFLRIQCTAVTADTVWDVNILYEEEDAF